MVEMYLYFKRMFSRSLGPLVCVSVSYWRHRFKTVLFLIYNLINHFLNNDIRSNIPICYRTHLSFCQIIRIDNGSIYDVNLSPTDILTPIGSDDNFLKK